MSMQAWEVPNPSDNGNNYHTTIDPSMAFAGGTPTSSNFDFSNMQNPQLQRMQNGTMRNGTTPPAGFNPSMYQTTSVVPAKRQHDFTGSPRQASRSQTPQQGPYPGYTGMNGQTPNPYQHLQQSNSSNASPSPIMQTQQYNPSAIPQRMSTASPSPYSPIGPNYAPQASPLQPDYSNRIENPLNTNPGFIQGGQVPNGMSQNFVPQPGYLTNGMPAYSMPGMTSEQQRTQQAQAMRQMQAQNMVAQQRAHAQAQAQAQAHAQAQAQAQAHAHAQAQMGAMQTGMNDTTQMMNMQPPNVRDQILRYQAARLDAVMKSPEEFASTVATFMLNRNAPFQKYCVFSNRQTLHCAPIFNIVAKYGGSRKVTMGNGWPQIAVALQVAVQLAGETQNYFQNNLAPYEPTWQAAMTAHGSKMAMQQHPSAGRQDPAALAHQMQLQRAAQYNQEQMAVQTRKQSAPPEVQTPIKGHLSLHQANGLSPPQHGQTIIGASQQPHPRGASRKGRPSVEPKQEPDTEIGGVRFPWTTPLAEQIGENFVPLSRQIPHPDKDGISEEIQEHHGGFILGSSTMNSVVANNMRARPDYTRVHDSGNIEIHALLMSLKSGIPGEVRLALDTISAIVWEPIAVLGPLGPNSGQMSGNAHRLNLGFKECGDLVESLVDCAEFQLDFLADNTDVDEYSDSLSFRPVEEIARETISEINSLQDIPENGSIDYDLDQTAEKLLCITTILRNLTELPQHNRIALADASVVKLMANIIRNLGSRHMLLRTYRNTFDFLKDAVSYFSAVANDITLSSKDEASWILQFLLSFAPPIQQLNNEDNELYFPAYMRGSHKYLPFAIQTFAKLLASGDPNRAYLKSVFAADISSGSFPDLLTRAFAMSISPLPSLSDEIYPKIRSRATFLTQGLLAADSLVTLIPPAEHGLARAWLSSEDGFAERLLRIIAKLSINFQPPRVVSAQGHIDDGHDLVQEYGLSILRKLAERAKDADTSVGQLSTSMIFKKALLSAAMTAGPMQERTLQSLVGYLSLDI